MSTEKCKQGLGYSVIVVTQKRGIVSLLSQVTHGSAAHNQSDITRIVSCVTNSGRASKLGKSKFAAIGRI
jgi:hypothetical protein